MLPRAFMFAVLAVVCAAMLPAVANAQLRASEIRELSPEAPESAGAPALARTAGGYVSAWRAKQFTLAVRMLGADGVPTGPVRTIPKPVGLWDPVEVHLVATPAGALLITVEAEDGGVYDRVAVRRIGADGTPVAG